MRWVGYSIAFLCGLSSSLLVQSLRHGWHSTVEAPPAGRSDAGSLPKATSVPVVSTDDDCGSMEAELRLTQRLLSDMIAEIEGVPIAWDEESERLLAPDAFRQAMGDVGEECEHLQVVSVDCSEPPCIGAVAVNADVPISAANTAMLECPPWQRHHPHGFHKFALVNCDGRKVSAIFVGPEEMSASTPTDPIDIENIKKRHDYRRKRIADAWPCDDVDEE